MSIMPYQGLLKARSLAAATSASPQRVLSEPPRRSPASAGIRRALAALAWLLAFPSAALAQGALQNGALHPGQISPAGDADTWTFSSPAKAGIYLRVGSTNFTPKIRLLAPNGTELASTTSGNGLARDGFITAEATDAGEYRVEVSATFAGQTGTYGLHLAVMPGEFTTSAGDEGGDLPNGVATNARLTLGDLDVWTFNAGPGNDLMLRVGASGFTPWLRLYNPSGALLAETKSGNTLARDGVIVTNALAPGSYTLVVSATFGGQTGDYTVHRVRVPGVLAVAPDDEGGTLTNGVRQLATLPLGDLDAWTFDAIEGDEIMLRVGSVDFTPWLRLLDPAGMEVARTTSGNTLARDGVLTHRAAIGGTFTLVVSATFSGQDGSYGVHLARTPAPFTTTAGDDGGELTSGARTTGVIELGDLDLWSFAANAGEGLMLRVGGTNFTPWLRLYGPDGSLISETTSGNTLARDGVLSLQATNAGLHLLVLSATFSGQQGPYAVTLARAGQPPQVTPGDEGGELVNAITNDAVLGVGDLDVWSFYGTPGDSNALRVVATSFTPWMRLYGPDGALVRETIAGNTLARVGTMSLNITNAGTYTMVVSAYFSGQSGPYTFRQSRVPPDLIMPAEVTLDEGQPLQVAMSAQDPEEPAKPLSFQLLFAPDGSRIESGGPTNATLVWPTSEAAGPSTNVFFATVSDVVNGRTFIRTNLLTVVVREINTPPALTLPAEQGVNEGDTLRVTALATDADLPANTLTFSLAEGPEGLGIDPLTGAITWTPTEAQGPSVNTVTVVVTDSNPWAANATSLSVTNSFVVRVREVNQAPQLALPAPLVLDELTPLPATFAATASDADLPPNALTFSLAAAPAGMLIDPATGRITWTPTEAQGPSTNLVAVVVADASPEAINTTTLRVTNIVEIVVREVNTPPVLTLPADRTIPELQAVELQATAVDNDVPANALAFELLSGPQGLTLDPSTGRISWTPTEAQGPSVNDVVVVVSDQNPSATATSLRVTNSFKLTVTEVNSAPTLAAVEDRALHFGIPLSIQLAGADADLPANGLAYVLEQGPSGMTVDRASGALAWTPLESQVGEHVITVRVEDDATPALTATRTFRVTVQGSGSRLDITLLAGGLAQLKCTGDVGAKYDIQTSTDLVAWTRLVEFTATAEGYLFIDPASAGTPAKFYRLQLRQ